MSVVGKVFRDYGNFKLQFENWELPEKGILALWGPSGSGKSSLVQCLLGLDLQADVIWNWGEEALHEVPVEKRNLSVVFQDLALFPHMSVKSNILFPVDRKHRDLPFFENIISMLQLENRLGQPVGQLSGGERQRVAIARACIYKPRMIFLDEPFSSLDPETRERTRKLVGLVSESLNIPMILITHALEDVEALASLVTTIQMGRNMGTVTRDSFLT